VTINKNDKNLVDLSMRELTSNSKDVTDFRGCSQPGF